MILLEQETQALAVTVEKLCGVALDSTKGYLIEHRLGPVAERFDCSSYSELCARLQNPAEQDLRAVAIDAITTHETLFFRDSSPFEALSYRVLPLIVDSKTDSIGAKRLRFWSAACSTGQEAYSIAMTVREMIPDADDWDIQITATDISEAAVDRASSGIYSEYEMGRGMRPELRDKYFAKIDAGWRVRDNIRTMVRFQKLNLLDPFPPLGPFDAILCRHVAIYFHGEARRDLYRRLVGALTPSGFLFLSNSESLEGQALGVEQQTHCGAVFYQRVGNG